MTIRRIGAFADWRPMTSHDVSRPDMPLQPMGGAGATTCRSVDEWIAGYL